MGFCWFTAFQEFDKQLIFPSSGIDNLNIQLLNNFIGSIQLKLYFHKTNSWEFKNFGYQQWFWTKEKHFLYFLSTYSWAFKVFESVALCKLHSCLRTNNSSLVQINLICYQYSFNKQKMSGIEGVYMYLYTFVFRVCVLILQCKFNQLGFWIFQGGF